MKNYNETRCEQQQNRRRIVITGGFSDDQSVYMLNCGGGGGGGGPNGWTTTILQPEQNAEFVYGASLTTLPSIQEDGKTISRAVRFGGFRSGGSYVIDYCICLCDARPVF